MQARSGVESCRAHPISGVQQYPVAHVRRRVSARNEPSGMHDLRVSYLNLIAPDAAPTIRHRVLPRMQGQQNPHMPVFAAVLRRNARILRRNAAKRCGICRVMTLAARLNMEAVPAIACACAGPPARAGATSGTGRAHRIARDQCPARVFRPAHCAATWRPGTGYFRTLALATFPVPRIRSDTASLKPAPAGTPVRTCPCAAVPSHPDAARPSGAAFAHRAWPRPAGYSAARHRAGPWPASGLRAWQRACPPSPPVAGPKISRPLAQRLWGRLLQHPACAGHPPGRPCAGARPQGVLPCAL